MLGLPAAPSGPARIAGGRFPCRHGRVPSARTSNAAFCTVNTFRHLLTEQSARRHLECIAQNLRPGGIYILGLHLLPMDASEEDTERWSERQGRTRVTVTLRVLSTDRRRRIERLGLSLLARVGAREVRLRDEFSFRMYTAAQFHRLLASVPSLELCGVYDFWYEIDNPMELNDDRTDTVFVLRKRGSPGQCARRKKSPSEYR